MICRYHKYEDSSPKYLVKITKFSQIDNLKVSNILYLKDSLFLFVNKIYAKVSLVDYFVY